MVKNTHSPDIVNNIIHSGHVIIHSFYKEEEQNYHHTVMTQNFTFANVIDNSNDDLVLVVAGLEKKLNPYTELILSIAFLFSKRCPLQIYKIQRFFMSS